MHTITINAQTTKQLQKVALSRYLESRKHAADFENSFMAAGLPKHHHDFLGVVGEYAFAHFLNSTAPMPVSYEGLTFAAILKNKFIPDFIFKNGRINLSIDIKTTDKFTNKLVITPEYVAATINRVYVLCVAEMIQDITIAHISGYYSPKMIQDNKNDHDHIFYSLTDSMRPTWNIKQSRLKPIEIIKMFIEKFDLKEQSILQTK